MRTPAQVMYAFLSSFALVGLLGAAALAPGQPPSPELAAPQDAVESTAPSGQSDAALADDDALPLEQGPVHEAFAAPVGQFGAVPEEQTKTVQENQPPAPVNELPPAEQPEGENVQWIPGYWMWSIDREDYVWVSGVWRDIPPGRQWTPGSWVQVDGGYAWSPGYWASTATTEVAYLPAPPASLEEGPSSPAPSDDHFWIPGCWTYANQNYQWRPGYWYRTQPNWVWVPSYYNYTPRGYIFVNGYWDMPLYNRGILYAPVYWNSPIYGRPGFAYRPRSVVNTALLVTSLFVNPYRNHYYYGGYGPGFRNQGLYPWFGYGNGGFGRPGFGGYGGYDPLFSYYRYGGRNPYGHNFNDLRRDYARFDNDRWDRDRWDGDRGAGGRGPGNWDGRDRDGRGPDGRDRDGRDGRGRGGIEGLIAGSIGDLDANSGRPSMRNLDDATRQRITSNIDQIQRYSDRRAEIEAGGDVAARVRGGAGRDGANLSADARTRLGLDGRGEGAERREAMRVPLEDFGVSRERIDAAREQAANSANNQPQSQNRAEQFRQQALDRARNQDNRNAGNRSPGNLTNPGLNVNRGDSNGSPTINNPLNNSRPNFNRDEANQRFRNQGQPNGGAGRQPNPNALPGNNPSDQIRQDAINRFRNQQSNRPQGTPNAATQPNFQNRSGSEAIQNRIQQRSNFRGPVQQGAPQGLNAAPQRGPSSTPNLGNPRSFGGNRSFNAPQQGGSPSFNRSFTPGGGGGQRGFSAPQGGGGGGGPAFGGNRGGGGGGSPFGGGGGGGAGGGAGRGRGR